MNIEANISLLKLIWKKDSLSHFSFANNLPGVGDKETLLV